MLRSTIAAPRLPLALAALALTAACSDAPLAPASAAPSARPSLAAAPAPSAFPPGTIPATFWVHPAGETQVKLPGTSVRFSTDKGIVDVQDNGPADYNKEDGSYTVALPVGSTFYRGEVTAVPLGYMMPTASVQGLVQVYKGTTFVGFPSVKLSAKKQVRVNFLNMQKQLVPGGTVVVTAPGWDFSWTITDGGAGDLTPLGAQAPADGTVTVYSPAFGIGEWKVCETAAPAGYLPTEPSCVSAKVQATKMTHTFNLLHQGGIVAPPPAS